MRVEGEVETQVGRKLAAILLNNAADINIISRAFMLQHNVPIRPNAALPPVTTFTGKLGYCYRAHYIRMRVADSSSKERSTGSIFYIYDMLTPNVILGRL